jgi:hypothetical protein
MMRKMPAARTPARRTRMPWTLAPLTTGAEVFSFSVIL